MKGIQAPRGRDWPRDAWLGLVLVAGLMGCAGGRAGVLPVGLHGDARPTGTSRRSAHGGPLPLGHFNRTQQ